MAMYVTKQREIPSGRKYRLTEGDARQVRAFWQKTAQEMLHHIGPRPTWLCTVGGGVAWLHVRLDSRPKYYSYGPYRNL
jgi:hypothetical protein